MKFKTIIFRYLTLVLLLMVISEHEMFSQEADTIRFSPKGLFVGLTLGPSQSMVNNSGTLSVSGLVNNAKMGISGSADVGYYLSKHFGISSGISFSYYHGGMSLPTYQNKFNTVDSENEAYERRVFGTNIAEEQKIAFLGVPAYLHFRIPFGERMGFSLRTGIEMGVPVVKNYHSSGAFTYKGYYPRYNVLLENLPAYGFQSNAAVVTDSKLELKPFYAGASVSAGLDYFIRKNVQAAVSVYYSRSLTDIRPSSTSPENFQLSADVSHINSLMGGSIKTDLQSTGVSFSLRYYLNRR